MRYLLGAVLLLAVTATGCVTQHPDVFKTAPPRPAPPRPPPVTAGQVSNDNAHAISQALWDEMDRESQNDLLNEPSGKPSPTKK